MCPFCAYTFAAKQPLDANYQVLQRTLGARVTFFNDIRTLTRYFVFTSWDHLLSFMLEQLEIQSPPNTS